MFPCPEQTQLQQTTGILKVLGYAFRVCVANACSDSIAAAAEMSKQQSVFEAVGSSATHCHERGVCSLPSQQLFIKQTC